MGWMVRSSNPGRGQEILLYVKTSRPALGFFLEEEA
jgi:hypothetical protein